MKEFGFFVGYLDVFGVKIELWWFGNNIKM